MVGSSSRDSKLKYEFYQIRILVLKEVLYWLIFFVIFRNFMSLSWYRFDSAFIILKYSMWPSKPAIRFFGIKFCLDILNFTQIAIIYPTWLLSEEIIHAVFRIIDILLQYFLYRFLILLSYGATLFLWNDTLRTGIIIWKIRSYLYWYKAGFR